MTGNVLLLRRKVYLQCWSCQRWECRYGSERRVQSVPTISILEFQRKARHFSWVGDPLRERPGAVDGSSLSSTWNYIWWWRRRVIKQTVRPSANWQWCDIGQINTPLITLRAVTGGKFIESWRVISTLLKEKLLALVLLYNAKTDTGDGEVGNYNLRNEGRTLVKELDKLFCITGKRKRWLLVSSHRLNLRLQTVIKNSSSKS